MRYVTGQGTTVALGKQIAEDAKAAVFEVAGSKDRVGKVYSVPPIVRQSRKLAELVKLASADLLKCSAWPIDTLHPAEGEPARGILMPRIQGAVPLHKLYSPAHRRFAFPQADWRLLVKAARSCASAINQMHYAGVVVGDVSANRMLVDPEGNIKLLGCDSFQLIRGEEVFFINTTTPEYLAPELQNMPLETAPVTRNHDAFGLAVVIFRLLMMGRHPFVGYRGPQPLSVGEAIFEHRFAYGTAAASLKAEPPPHSPLLTDLPGPLANLFQRTFARGADKEGARPASSEWIKALDDLARQITPCEADPGHYYFAGLSNCPWCRIQRGGGPAYFSSVTLRSLEASAQNVDTHQLLDEFETIVAPEKHFSDLSRKPLLPATPTPLPRGTREFQQLVWGLGVLTLGSGLVMLLGFLTPNFLYIAAPITVSLLAGWLLAFFGSPLFRIRLKRRRTVAARQAELAALQREIAAAAARHTTDWSPRYKSAAEVRDKLRALDAQEANDMKLLQATLRDRQLEEYLARFLIRDAKIQQLTPSRMTVLESYNIETARDITESSLAGLTGLGDTLPSTLLAWRRTMESGFSFDPSRGFPAAELAIIRNKYLQQRLALQQQLEVDIEALAKLSAAARTHANRFTVPLAAAQSAVVQAKADLTACKSR